MKKTCLALALFLVLAAVVPARAAGTRTVVTSEVSLPTLEETPVVQVTVPQTGHIIINPYGLETEIDGSISTEQIASETLTIYNESEVPVIVSASAEGLISEASSMVFTSAPPAADTVEKEVFLYAEFQKEDGLWSGSYQAEENQLLISEDASAAKEVLTLDAGPSEGVFRMFGATSVSPAEPWSAEDHLSVTFTFTFSPVSEPAPDQVPDNEELPVDEGAAPPIPEETFVPEETPAPEETPVPKETLAPEETPAPKETPTPEETPAPKETPTPEETPAPEETDAPATERDAKTEEKHE